MRPFLRSALIALSCVPPAIVSCWAADDNVSGPRFETYAGADYDSRSASLTTTAVWSLFGPVTQPGLRIKLDGLADAYGETAASVFSGGFQVAGLKGDGDLMAGYLFERDPLWIKVYAGAAYQLQARLVWQAGQIVKQEIWGAAGTVESYWQVSDRAWASAGASWMQPDNTTSLYSRAAYEIYRSTGGLRISAGAEAALTVSNADDFKEGRALDLYDDYVRGGALINLRYGANDFTVSGGMSQASGEAAWCPYATVRFGRQF
ncbi:MAG: cellulose biosynthesis protein BcsS [Rhodomicrobium sp.]